MNPLLWSREERAALIVAAVIGAAVGIIVGYMVYALGYGADALPFGAWIWRPIRHDVIWWAIFGGLVGAALVYVRRLLRERP